MSQYFTCILVFAVIILNTIEGVQFRLPTTVVPLFYTLKIEPDVTFEWFDGEVTIDTKITNVINSIYIHQSNLTIVDLRLDGIDLAIDYRIDNDYELLEIFMENRTKPINPGNHRIYVKFIGKIDNSPEQVGFFKSVHTGDGEISVLALTKTQPIYTRRVFPCFDEPQIKSRFKITIIAPNSTWVVLSNMRKIADYPISENTKRHVHQFETSWIMSTYLVEFSLSHFTYKEHKFDRNYGELSAIRAFTPKASQSRYLGSLRFVEYCLKSYGNYTRFDYEIPKLDLIEYDRIHGRGTENWGLVILTSGTLFTNDVIVGNATVPQFSFLLAHEIAHFWFGNLVTNRWWSDLWLQEGFAQFFAHKIAARFQQSNELSFTIDSIFLQDEADSTQPIVHYLERAYPDIPLHFNPIIYNKSLYLLNMIELALGREKFQEAVGIFIKKFAFNVATTLDFIEIVQNQEPLHDFRGFIESYLYQKHYPVVHVTEVEDNYILTQNPCVQPQEINPLEYKWTIPITYLTDSGEGMIWFHKDMEEVKLRKNGSKWVKFNRKFFGLYKMDYSQSLWDKFVNHSAEIDHQEREILLYEFQRVHSYEICPQIIAFIEKVSQIDGVFSEFGVQFLTGLHNTLNYFSKNDESLGILLDYMTRREIFTLFNEDGDILRSPIRDSVSSVRDVGIDSCSEWIKNNLSKLYLNET